MLLVVLSHFSLAGVNLLPALDFSGAGKAGVYLFFVLSAFLLTLQAFHQSPEEMHGIKYWTGYGIRRVLRIFPLYTVVLIIAYCLTRWTDGYGPKISSAEELLRHVLLLQGNHIFWAIPVEFKYYVLLPAVTLGLFWLSRINRWLPLPAVAVTIAGLLYIWPQSEAVPNSISLGPYLLIFVLGSAIAYLTHLDVSHRIVRELTGWTSLAMAMMTIPSLWRAAVAPEITNQYFHQQFLLYGIVWALAVYAAVSGESWYRRFFELQIWRFLGRISFSVYLLHFPLIQLIAKYQPGHGSLKFVTGMACTLAISYLTYRFIERPFIIWGHSRTRDTS